MVVTNTIDKDTEAGSATGKAPPPWPPHAMPQQVREKKIKGVFPSTEKTPYAWSG